MVSPAPLATASTATPIRVLVPTVVVQIDYPGAAPEIALAPGFTDWPDATLPVFVAMMFGGTLGGNATLIGASANIVAVGICASNGRRVSFMQFLRIGLPITVAQLSIGALYVWGLTSVLG